MKCKTAFFAAVALGATFIAAGCGGSSGSSSSTGAGTIAVVATTTQVADLVRETGGDEVEVTQILQPNTDPHEYEPRPADVEAFAEADLVFRSGEHLDEWTDQLIDDSGSDAEVIDLSASTPVERRDGDELDPHWWHDPINAIAAVGEIKNALIASDPKGKATIAADAADYRKRLEALNASIAKCFNTIPDDQRKMVTDHDAFGYLADRYDIEVVGTVIPAMTTQAEPSAGDLAELEQTIRDEKVKAIFSENSVPKKLFDAVAADTGASAEYGLYGDTLGPEGSAGMTYIEMMRSNANNLMLGFTGGKRDCEFD